MPDYISRKSAIDACFDGWNLEPKDCAINIQQLPAADVAERPRWISVKERLPDESGNYLTAFGDGTAMAVNEFMHPRGWLTEEGRKANPNGKWYWGGVTHWMPLPAPPEEKRT